MRIKYIDINTGEIKSAEFFEFDPTLNKTTLRDSDGRLFVISEWQRDYKEFGIYEELIDGKLVFQESIRGMANANRRVNFLNWYSRNITEDNRKFIVLN